MKKEYTKYGPDRKKINRVNWNKWRADYPTMSFLENQRFHDKVFSNITQPNAFNEKAVTEFFDSIKSSVKLKVAELGGAKGELACRIIRKNPAQFQLWDNFELSSYMVENQICFNKKYLALKLVDYINTFQCILDYDVFLASHVIEHMLFKQFKQLIENLPTSIKYIYLNIPIDIHEPKDWDYYAGTHVFDKTWIDIFELLNENRFFSYQTSEHQNKCYKNNYRWFNAPIYFFKKKN